MPLLLTPPVELTTYRAMIRWKAGLMWRMAQLDAYDFAWSLDTDSFLQVVCPLSS